MTPLYSHPLFQHASHFTYLKGCGKRHTHPHKPNSLFAFISMHLTAHYCVINLNNVVHLVIELMK